MVNNILESPCIKLPSSFTLMLAINNITQLIVCDDLFICIITTTDKELDVLMIFSISVHDLTCNLGPDMLPSVSFM